MVLANHDAIIPGGNPVATPIPVAPVVLCVIVVSAVLTHKVGVELGALTVFVTPTMILPVAFTKPHPPVKGIE